MNASLGEGPDNAPRFAGLVEDRGEGVVEDAHGVVDVGFFRDERRVGGDLERGPTGPDHDAVLEGVLLDGFDGVLPGVDAGIKERFAGFGVGDFEGPEESPAADVTHDVVAVFEGIELFFEIGSAVFDVLEEAVFVLVDRRDAGGARDGVARERLADTDAVGSELVGDCWLHQDPGEGGVGARDAFGEDEHVGFDVLGHRSEPFAGATEACDDFVGDHEDVVFVTEFSDTREIPGWGGIGTAGAGDGFHEDGGDRVGVFVPDDEFEVVGGFFPEFFWGVGVPG